MSKVDENYQHDSMCHFNEIVQHILVVAPALSAATWIAYQVPFDVLSGSTFSWRIIPEYYLKPEDLSDINLLILYRCTRGSTLSVIRLARRKQIKVIYELDDDLLDPPPDEMWGKSYRISHLPQIIGKFLDEAHLVKAGSPELANRIRKKGYSAMYQHYGARIYNLPDETTNPPYRIGYFATPHHKNDIEKIFPALMAIKKFFQEQIEFEFIGCYPRDWQQLKASILPYEPAYEVFQQVLAKRRWSLGLAPLRKTSFNEAKSNSKFRDYTAAGVPGVYADLAPYRETVMHEENGWLAGDSPEEWYEMIKRALLDPNRPNMLLQAKKLLQQVYSPEAVAQNWVSLIREINA